MLIENTTFMLLPATVVLRTPISPDRLGRIFKFGQQLHLRQPWTNTSSILARL